MSNSLKNVFVKSCYEKVVESLANGTIPWRGKMYRFPIMNFSTEGFYGMFNTFVLYIETVVYPEYSPFWIGFKQCEKLGGSILKGSRHTKIYKISCKKYTTTQTNEHGDEEEVDNTFKWLHYLRVFNLTQTTLDWRDKYEEYLANNSVILEADSVVSNYQSHNPKLTFLLDQPSDRVFYRAFTDTIVCSPIRMFKTSGDYYFYLFHEIAHSAQHRIFAKNHFHKYDDINYAFNEIVADITASALSDFCGLKLDYISDTDKAASYLTKYLDTASKAKSFALIQAFKDAELLMSYILTGINLPVKNVA